MRPAMRFGRRFLRDRRGAAAVEFGLVVTPLLLLMLGIIEGGRMLWTQNALHYAVEEAARCYAVNGNVCPTPASAKTFASTRAGLTIDSSVFTVANAACGKQASASYPFNFLTTLLNYSVTL